MSNVVNLGCITRLNLPPDRILDAAKGQLTQVFVIGYTEDGTLYAASSHADGGDALWLLEHAKTRLLQCGKVIPEASE